MHKYVITQIVSISLCVNSQVLCPLNRFLHIFLYFYLKFVITIVIIMWNFLEIDSTYPRLAWNFWFSCLVLLKAEITGGCGPLCLAPLFRIRYVCLSLCPHVCIHVPLPCVEIRGQLPGLCFLPPSHPMWMPGMEHRLSGLATSPLSAEPPPCPIYIAFNIWQSYLVCCLLIFFIFPHDLFIELKGELHNKVA